MYSLALSVLVSVASSLVPVLQPGQYEVTGRARLLSHPGFDRVTRYRNSRRRVWRLGLGGGCVELEVVCVFLETWADRRCSKGDILSMKSKAGTLKYCGTRKPSTARPAVFTEPVVITWRTDRTRTRRGWDCRVRCSKKAVPSSECRVVAGPGRGKPCIFPFTWLHTGLEYDGCVYHCPLVLHPHSEWYPPDRAG